MITTEAIAAAIFFVVLTAAWGFLPNRFVRNGRGEARAAATRPGPNGAASGRLPAPRPGPAPIPAPDGTRPRRGGVGMRLERNLTLAEGADGVLPGYFLVVDLGGLHGIGQARVPVHRRLNPGADILRKEIYWAEIAGLKLEAGNLHALEGMVREAVVSLLRARNLPWYQFLLPDGGTIPVLVQNGLFEARIPGGPRLTAQTLGGLRERICEYLARFGRAAADREVSILTLTPDLRYVPPIAVLMGNGLWLPVFRLGEMLVVGEGTGNGFHARYQGAADLLRLRREVAARLLESGCIRAAVELRLGALEAPTAEEIRGVLGPPVGHLTYLRPDPEGLSRVALPVFGTDGELVCTPPGAPSVLWFGRDQRELCDHVGLALEQADAIFHRDGLRFEGNAVGTFGRVG